METVVGLVVLVAVCYGLISVREYIRDRAEQARSERERAQGGHGADSTG